MNRFVLLLFVVGFFFLGFGLVQANTGPKASLNVQPMRGSLQTEFLFDASGSVTSVGTSSGLEYRFSPDFPSIPFKNWQRNPRFAYVYEKHGLGEKQVTVEIRDQSGLKDRASARISVLELQQVMSGYFSVSPLEGTFDTDFSFVAHVQIPNTTNPDDYTIRWDFNGDSIFDTKFLPERTAHHHYGEVGFYQPHAQLKSPEGTIIDLEHLDFESDKNPLGISMADAQTPIARLQVNQIRGIASVTTFHFDGSQSWDRYDGYKLSYRYDFGTGIPASFSNDPIARHIFETPGTYKITLEVKDKDGNTDQSSVSVLVVDEDHKPSVTLSIYQPSGVLSGTTGTIGTKYRFVAKTADLDENSSQLKVRWDFDGDSVFDTPYSEGKIAYHIYSNTGKKRVTVEVIDSTNQSARSSQEITIVQNTPPRVSIKVEPLLGSPHTSFEITIVTLEDDQFRTSQLQTRYDFDDDGVFDTKFSHSRKATHRFESLGDKTVVVQVRDPQGLIAQDRKTITVVKSTPPHAEILVEPQGFGTFSTRFSLSASPSFDRETSERELLFRWDLSYNGADDIAYNTGFSKNNRQFVSFDEVGDHVVRLEVKDADGMSKEAVSTLSIHWASPYIEELRKRKILNGFESGDMKPEQGVTRAEFLKMILLEQSTDPKLSSKVSTRGMKFQKKFTDVSKKDWHWRYVEKAFELGYINGYSDGTFQPNRTLNRAEATAIVKAAYEVRFQSPQGESSFTDVKTSDWFFVPIHAVYQAGLFSGYPDGAFQPSRVLTRGEAAKVVYLLINDI